MTIEEYLQGYPITYDFTDDCCDSTAYRAKKGFHKYFAYRSSKPVSRMYPEAVSAVEGNYQVGDPDIHSRLLQDIYKALWPDIEAHKSEYMMSHGRICSDTMISIQTTLNYYIRSMMPEVLEKNGRISSLLCIQLYNTNKAFREMLNKSENLIKLVSSYHTLGNYLPVSWGFNVARSGWYGNRDFIDLSLMKIREYYNAAVKNSLQSPIMELLHCDSKVMCCQKWLDSYDSWETFVHGNFLDDFVDANWQPIPLCDGHSWENPQVHNFEDFFRNSWQLIEKRSARMIKKLSDIGEGYGG